MTSTVRLFKLAKQHAVRDFGSQSAFNKLGPTLQEALIARQLLWVLDSQDSAVSDSTVRQMLADFVEQLRDAEAS